MLTELQRTIHTDVPLGHKSPYPQQYDKSLLYPVQRNLQRQAMQFPNIAFKGFDVWNAYELFWLDRRGKPVRTYATFVIPASSPNLCESKSVKLYLNSLNHEHFSSPEQVRDLIQRDLSDICQEKVEVMLGPDLLAHISETPSNAYQCLDDLDIDIKKYQRAPQLLVADFNQPADEKLVSHLFKSHCLCTGQPDMGSIFIEYVGPKISNAGLLAYLVSYRDHVGFSENCVEQMFVDILERANPQKLLVFGRFTRRGGIDINPYRCTHEVVFHNERLIYQ